MIVIRGFTVLKGTLNWQSKLFKNHNLRLLGIKCKGGGVRGCSQWAESRWRKTEQRSQRSAGGDSGSVGRPLRHILSGCGMTAQDQLVLDARAATGRSVQVIKPFMHSSTHPQAFCASRLGKATIVYYCFCWTLISLLPSFLPVLSCIRCLSFFLINPWLYLLSASLFSNTFTLANTLTSKDSATLDLKVCPTPSVLCTLPLVSHPQRVSITSSHSEAKEGMRSMDGCPDLQLDTDPLRPVRPPSSSPSGDANKSESDLDKLRVRPRSAGLALNAATGADTSLESLLSALGL